MITSPIFEIPAARATSLATNGLQMRLPEPGALIIARVTTIGQKMTGIGGVEVSVLKEIPLVTVTEEVVASTA